MMDLKKNKLRIVSMIGQAQSDETRGALEHAFSCMRVVEAIAKTLGYPFGSDGAKERALDWAWTIATAAREGDAQGITISFEHIRGTSVESEESIGVEDRPGGIHPVAVGQTYCGIVLESEYAGGRARMCIRERWHDGKCESPEICPGCQNEIDPEVCGCGTAAYRYGNPMDEGHTFVPLGCDCMRACASEKDD